MFLKKSILMFILLSLILKSCTVDNILLVEPMDSTEANNTPPVSISQLPHNSTSTLVLPTTHNSPTPEVSPMIPTETITPLPTIDKHPPTAVVERPVEWDLDPYIIRNIDTEWQGVRIKASVIIDSSLEDMVEDLRLIDSTLAEIVARTIFLVWYTRLHPYVYWNQYSYDENIYPPWDFHDHVYPCPKDQLQACTHKYVEENIRPEPIEPFMELWAKAQQSGNSSDWSRVQLNYIWANDMNEGNGYVQKPYNFWPMYEGETSYGVKALSELTIVLTDRDSATNLQTDQRYSNGSGLGTNLDGSQLLIYKGVGEYTSCSSQSNFEKCVGSGLRGELVRLGTWLILNDGRTLNYNTAGDNTMSTWGIEFIIFEK